jgi:hypothetical protein
MLSLLAKSLTFIRVQDTLFSTKMLELKGRKDVQKLDATPRKQIKQPHAT